MFSASPNLLCASGIEWWPEFELPIGTPVETHDHLQGYWRAEWGCYARNYSRGLVLLSPNASVAIQLPEPMLSAQPWGGEHIFSSVPSCSSLGKVRWGSGMSLFASLSVSYDAGGAAGRGYDLQLGVSCSELVPASCGIRTRRTSAVVLGGHAARAAILLHNLRQQPG